MLIDVCIAKQSSSKFGGLKGENQQTGERNQYCWKDFELVEIISFDIGRNSNRKELIALGDIFFRRIKSF